MMKQFYPVFVALAFNGLDLATGLLAAIRVKNVCSSKLRDGLFKKSGFLILYFLAWLLDTQGNHIGFQIGFSVLPALVLYVCTTESVSVIENVCKINPSLANTKIMDIFKFKEDTNERHQ